MEIPKALPSADLTVGAMFIGSTISAIFYGMTNIQVIVYYHSYPKDPLIHKLSAAILWTLDTFHLILVTHAVYHYAIGSLGQAIFPLDLVWSSKLQAVVNSVILLVVQSLYVMRIWKLNGYYHGVLGYLAAGIILVGFGVGIALDYELYSLTSLIQMSTISWAIKAQLSAATAIDVVITILILICLRKSQSVLTSLKSRLARVIVYTLISGFATSLCGIAALLAFLFMPHNFVYVALGFILTRLHVNSFLGLLNARPRNSTERTEPVSSQVLSVRSPTTRQDFRGQFSPRTWQHDTQGSLGDVESPLTENTPSVYSRSMSSKELVTKEASLPTDFTPRAI